MSNEQTHTPGPWHVAPERKAQSPWIVCDRQGGSVADCEPPGPWMSGKEADANARLIAAAPEMLATLKMLTACDKNGRFGEPDFPAAVAAARAAIARAEGAP